MSGPFWRYRGRHSQNVKKTLGKTAIRRPRWHIFKTLIKPIENVENANVCLGMFVTTSIPSLPQHRKQWKTIGKTAFYTSIPSSPEKRNLAPRYLPCPIIENIENHWWNCSLHLDIFALRNGIRREEIYENRYVFDGKQRIPNTTKGNPVLRGTKKPHISVAQFI